MDFFRNDETEDEPPTLRFRPCLAELVRTEYCAPCIILLVHKIWTVDVQGPHETLKAFKIWFGDGEKLILGILRKETHRYVLTEETTVGSYVMLDKYELKKAKRLDGKGEVWHLAIQDFHTVGQEEGMREREEKREAQQLQDEQDRIRNEEMEKTKRDGNDQERDSSYNHEESNKRVKLDQGRSPKPATASQTSDVLGASSQNEKIDKAEDQSNPNTAHRSFEEKENAPKPPPVNSTGLHGYSAGRKRRASWLDEPIDRQAVDAKDPSAISKGSLESPTRKERRISKYENRYSTSHHHTPLLPLAATVEADYPRPTPPTVNPPQPPRITTSTKATSRPSLPPTPTPNHLSALPKTPASQQSIQRPLSLTPLSSLPTLPKKQNALLDVLALIVSTSTHTVKRPNMPLKRDMRLVDLTTPKRVLLSVFVDAENFLPEEGTVAIFRGVRNHRWEGGSLNAYPGDCEGVEWFLPLGGDRGLPEGIKQESIPWDSVRALRAWWEEEKKRLQAEMASVGADVH